MQARTRTASQAEAAASRQEALRQESLEALREAEVHAHELTERAAQARALCARRENRACESERPCVRVRGAQAERALDGAKREAAHQEARHADQDQERAEELSQLRRAQHTATDEGEARLAELSTRLGESGEQPVPTQPHAKRARASTDLTLWPTERSLVALQRSAEMAKELAADEVARYDSRLADTRAKLAEAEAALQAASRCAAEAQRETKAAQEASRHELQRQHVRS